jgi:hypothetical protein
MIINLKILIRNFNCENYIYYIGNSREFGPRICIFKKKNTKIKYYNYYVKGCYLLSPGVLVFVEN